MKPMDDQDYIYIIPCDMVEVSFLNELPPINVMEQEGKHEKAEDCARNQSYPACGDCGRVISDCA